MKWKMMKERYPEYEYPDILTKGDTWRESRVSLRLFEETIEMEAFLTGHHATVARQIPTHLSTCRLWLSNIVIAPLIMGPEILCCMQLVKLRSLTCKARKGRKAILEGRDTV